MCVCVCQVTHKRAAYRSITNGFSHCQGKKRKLSGFVLWNEKNVVQCTLAVVVFCCG